MPNSPRFQTLRDRIDKLRVTFLPADFDPTGTYDQEIYDKTTAFRLLVHSEFESFAEDIVTDIVGKAMVVWNSSGKTTIPILCILASYDGVERINKFVDNQTKKRPITINTLIHKSFKHFEYNVTSNNGIRTKNILALFIQAGIEDTELDATWVGSIDAFGAHRNVVGHKSNVVSYQADPKTALEAANTICDGFALVDEKLLTMAVSF